VQPRLAGANQDDVATVLSSQRRYRSVSEHGSSLAQGTGVRGDGGWGATRLCALALAAVPPIWCRVSGSACARAHRAFRGVNARAIAMRRIAHHLCTRAVDHPLRVAVDGITAAGKSTLASELVSAVRVRGRPADHLSMDDFHFPRDHRYRRGRDSAIGYYEDAFDFDALRNFVLAPLGVGGDRQYRRAVHDLATDTPVDQAPLCAQGDLVVIVDGTFLQRVLDWDQVIYVDTSFDVALARAVERDSILFGGSEAARRAYEIRYHAACHRYVEEYGPAERATIVVGNDDPESPWLRWNEHQPRH
jgi:uridine kinase